MTDKKIRNWDERYAGTDYLFGTEPNDFLVSVASRIPDRSDVLCLADGEGRNGVHLATLGHKVTAIDQSSTGLKKAEQLAADKGVSLTTIVADLSDYDLGDAKWDCIVSIFFHMPSELREKIYPRIVSALKPGGILILESYRPEQLEYGTGGPPIADYLLTEEIVLDAFADLHIDHLVSIERDVLEGSGHTGRAAVLQLVAVRNPA